MDVLATVLRSLAITALVLIAAVQRGWTEQAGPGTTEGAARMNQTANATFGPETVIAEDERIYYSRAVNFAPSDGQICRLNPPRFRWQFHPTMPGEGGDFTFTFEIADDPAFENKVVSVDTPFNFYNTLAPLPGPGPYYWRVGYRSAGASDIATRSRVRSFTIGPDAIRWDRSMLAAPDFSKKPHPRILFNAGTLPGLRELVARNADSKAILENMRREADETIGTNWWKEFPQSDVEQAEIRFISMLSRMVNVAFVWKVTGDDMYSGVLERAITVARYPKGGRSSPQGSGGEAAEDSTQSSEFLGLLYDWLYQDMTEDQRRDFAASLDWRIDAFVNTFAWRQEVDGRRTVADYSLSTHGGSHPFEGFWDTFPAALAAYEESPAAREAFHLGVNYFAGVSSAHGYEEAWNEGPGYGNSKWSWQVNSLCYLDSVFPDFAAGSNPWLARMGEYLRAVTPVGLRHAPWGHGSNNASYYENGHRRSYRKLAFLTGDGRFLANWRHYGTVDGQLERPWIECALPLWRATPREVTEEETVRSYPLDGWVTALSGTPSDPATYAGGVGMIFCARPRGGYSHSFACDNSFHIFAYGQDISHAGGTSDYEAYPFSSMSHNTILVDGLGQGGPRLAADRPWYARIMAFGAVDGVAYWCGDATNAYPRKPAPVRHWWGSLGDAYEKIDVSHLERFHRHVLFVRNKYFVILDDLEAAKPTRWTWLYHVEKADEFSLDERTGSFDYSIGGVRVKVAHLLGAGLLDARDRVGAEGLMNPITGEDYREGGDRAIVAEHNVWLTTHDAHEEWRFMSVVYPVAPGAQVPVFEAIEDAAVRITAGDEVDVISFDGPLAEANIVVDVHAIRGAALP